MPTISHTSTGAETVDVEVELAAYVTTGKFIEGDGFSPTNEAYYRPEFWQSDNGSLFTFAAFLRHPNLPAASYFNAEICSDLNIQIYFRRWNATAPSLRNAFLIYLTDGATGDEWVGETLGADDSGIEAGDWFALMISCDYSGAVPVVEIWTHKVGDAAAVNINNGPLWAYDTGPVTFSFDTPSGGGDMRVGFLVNGAVDFDISEIYITNEFVDWSDSAERLKYVDAAGKPVGLGVDGSDLTGTQPKHYAPDGDLTNNVGSESNFTEVGTISNSTTSPSD